MSATLHVVDTPRRINDLRERSAAMAQALADRVAAGETTCMLWIELDADGVSAYGLATDRPLSRMETAGLVAYLQRAVMDGELDD